MRLVFFLMTLVFAQANAAKHGDEPFFILKPREAVQKIEKNEDSFKDILQSNKGFLRLNDSECLELSGDYKTKYEDIEGEKIVKVKIDESCHGTKTIRFRVLDSAKNEDITYVNDEIFYDKKRQMLLLQNKRLTLKAKVLEKKYKDMRFKNFFGIKENGKAFGCWYMIHDLSTLK